MVLNHNNRLQAFYIPKDVDFNGFSATSPFSANQFTSLLDSMNKTFDYENLVEKMVAQREYSLATWAKYLDILEAGVLKKPFSQTALNASMVGKILNPSTKVTYDSLFSSEFINQARYFWDIKDKNRPAGASSDAYVVYYTLGNLTVILDNLLVDYQLGREIRIVLQQIIQYIGWADSPELDRTWGKTPQLMTGSVINERFEPRFYEPVNKTTSIKVKMMAIKILRQIMTLLFNVPIEEWYAVKLASGTT